MKKEYKDVFHEKGFIELDDDTREMKIPKKTKKEEFLSILGLFHKALFQLIFIVIPRMFSTGIFGWRIKTQNGVNAINFPDKEIVIANSASPSCEDAGKEDIYLISLPEQNAGIESDWVCKVYTNERKRLERAVFGVGLGVQGFDDGVIVCQYDKDKDSLGLGQYAILELTIEQLENAITEGEFNWHKVIGWQRWDFLDKKNKITVDKERKKITIGADVCISSYFEKCGYEINII